MYGEATERPGEPGDREGLFVFRLASPLRQAVLAREDGGRERLSARDPTSPRTGADQLDRLHPSPARRSTIGGLYDHRPVAPLMALIPKTARSPTDPPKEYGRGDFRTSRNRQRPRSTYPRRRLGPDPNALPRDGDALSIAADSTRIIQGCEKVGSR